MRLIARIQSAIHKSSSLTSVSMILERRTSLAFIRLMWNFQFHVLNAPRSTVTDAETFKCEWVLSHRLILFPIRYS